MKIFIVLAVLIHAGPSLAATPRNFSVTLGPGGAFERRLALDMKQTARRPAFGLTIANADHAPVRLIVPASHARRLASEAEGWRRRLGAGGGALNVSRCAEIANIGIAKRDVALCVSRAPRAARAAFYAWFERQSRLDSTN